MDIHIVGGVLIRGVLNLLQGVLIRGVLIPGCPDYRGVIILGCLD